MTNATPRIFAIVYQQLYMRFFAEKIKSCVSKMTHSQGTELKNEPSSVAVPINYRTTLSCYSAL